MITPGSDDAPVVTTTTASAVSGATALLNAVVNPRGSSTSASFVFGRDAALSGDLTTTSSQVLTGSANSVVSVAVSGLDPGATYYFRALATSSAGVVRGDIGSFTTARAPARPDPPVAVALQATGSVRVSWIAPADNGAVITSYRVSGSGSSGCETSSTTPTPAATSCVVSGLDGQTPYEFRVAAFNDAGGSPVSQTSFPVRPGARSLPVRFIKPPGQVLDRSRLRVRVKVGAAAQGLVVVSVGERRLCTASILAGRGVCAGVVHGSGATSLRAIFEGSGPDAGSTGAVIEHLIIPKLIIAKVRFHSLACVPVIDLSGVSAPGAVVTIWRRVPTGWTRWTNTQANRRGSWSTRLWPDHEAVTVRANAGGGQTPPLRVNVTSPGECGR